MALCSIVMMITIGALSVAHKVQMLHVARLHAEKANYFQVSTNAPMVVSLFYKALNKFHSVIGFFYPMACTKGTGNGISPCAAVQLLNLLYWNR